MTARVLVIMRHGKAEAPDNTPDMDRALTARGRAEARLGGEWLAARGITPDIVICSPARRTRQTWHEVAIGLGTGAHTSVLYDARLYTGGVVATLDAIRGVDAATATVLIVGHNPTVSALSHRLDEHAERTEAGLRTSEIAVHTVASTWTECATAALAASHLPRG